jgi:PAS domain S-box-containing protein
MANLLSALREGDFSVRARGARRDEPLGDVMTEINTLSRTLQEQRLSALEATALLRTVMEEIEVAIFAFDNDGRLRLANHAGQLLLGKPAERILGRDAAELGLAECLTGETPRLLSASFANGSGRWGMRRSLFREAGRPHHLIVIGDLSRTLREEELRAWQRLVRVLGHELNNSLAPIKSIAGSLGSLLRRDARPSDWEQDMRAGLDIIENRADGLSRFMQAYARLARLPVPTLAPCEVPALVHRVAALETRLPVTVVEGPALSLDCDAAQIEQVLINLLKNAKEAGGSMDGISLDVCGDGSGAATLVVSDRGSGMSTEVLESAMLPFFSTKDGGSGLGLALCREIIEAHGGGIRLENREGGGLSVTCSLPGPARPTDSESRRARLTLSRV